MSEPRGGSTNSTAIVALVAGVACFCFWGIGALLAIGLGLLARAEIARSQPRQAGEGLATAAIALGAFNLCLWVVGVGAWIAWVASASAGPTGVTRAPVTSGTSLVAPSGPLAAEAPSGSDPTPSPLPVPPNLAEPMASARRSTLSSRTRSVEETWLGHIRLVDVRAHSGGRVNSLQASLSEQLELAKAAHERVVLFAVAGDCLPCNGVALAMRDPRMQRALQGVRLVRVDVTEFADDLPQVGVPSRRIPGFARLATGVLPRAEDFIDGGEWDADIAANIAPVLGAFVRGRYRTRRHSAPTPELPGQTVL